MSPTSRSRSAGALLAAVTLGLAACSPTMTNVPYSASDGTRVDVTGDLRAVNLLVVAAEKGVEGAVQGALVNHTTEQQDFTLAVEGASPITMNVDPGATVYLGTEGGEEVLLDTVAEAPGSYLPATLEVAGESAELQIPVLDGTLPEYEDAVPRS